MELYTGGAIFCLIFGVGLIVTASEIKKEWLGYVGAAFLAGFVWLIPYLPAP